MARKKSATYPELTLLRHSQTRYPEDPAEARLETFPNRYVGRDYWITFDCPEFTSRCPVTNQPDFGRIRIRYIADKCCVESKSLKLYLFAFRNFNTFHEEAVNRILDDIVRVCDPREITVQGEFNARGGISISVEASYRKSSRRGGRAGGR
ncbi:MAG: 7-cyano-7-deazaguanine reductase [Lentisphaerae bacterium RIFOXYB12_FULL_65_16]|nr:MAG: 7-cyano-7-deazaguanine reductase [Lentisphaerae bacterium RIFOXYA12_64_32]OGV90483.1 MAG: 7-cyano-7-deazaguanine reductase [Lentisphaerae bacterium RIFOXYB12_FULL_65_16]